MNVWLAALASGVALVALVLLAERRGLTASRFGRTVRLGKLWARLSASGAGARLRRAFARGARRQRIDEARRRADAAAIASTMGEMKGALMKLGQMLSFVSDEIPPEYRAALQSLQAQAPPMDFPTIRDVAERELGMPLERAFARFDEKPLASASIGQVHRARLASGEDVAVKIQYPGVGDAIRADLANAGMLYRAMGLFYPNLDPGPLVEELRGRIGEELDYANEARNQRRFHALYDGHPFIRVPRVFPERSTARVLTAEFVAGRSFAEACADDAAARDRWGEIMWRFVFGNINRHGMFNADPHPGNYLFDAEGRVTFLDFGCVKVFPPGMLRDWRRLVLAHVTGDREVFRSCLLALGFIKAETRVPTELLYEYWAYFYEPIAADRPFTFTRAYNASSIRRIFAPEGQFAGLAKQLNMPRDFVFVNRIQWGVYSVLAHLESTNNWHRLQLEYLQGLPPQTTLGAADLEYRERRKLPMLTGTAAEALG